MAVFYLDGGDRKGLLLLRKVVKLNPNQMEFKAEIFSCSSSTIQNRFTRYGIELRRPKALNKALIQKLYVKEGRTIREVAEILDCSRETVRRRCKEFGVPLRRPGDRECKLH